ncbi:MAG: geranylgeranylglycerol-phosphate geranylgeranyltransferase [Bacteroidetes bacterium]|nr:geranylgeranylglycerol-phosphate geranylgeranyltransferase [Bacteroidota bacterium]
MIAFLKLIRIQNLLLIAFVQYLIRYCLIGAMVRFSGLQLQMSDFDFFLLSLSTVMIAAAGYIINDYFDTQIDRVNKPDKVIVGRAIKRRVAMGAHLVISFLAISIGFYLAHKVGMVKLGFIHVLSAGFLWFYSTDFKRQLVLGNLVVAMLAAMVPLIVGLYEIPLLIKKYRELLIESSSNFNFIFYFVAAYSGFSFLTTFIREVIKDLEDYTGDKEFGRNTIPVALGTTVSKGIVATLMIVCMVLITLLQMKQWASGDKISFYYFLIALQLPFAFLLYKISNAKDAKEYAFASRLSKLIMFLGICYTLVFYFLIAGI